jgi:hypothetical protein
MQAGNRLGFMLFDIVDARRPRSLSQARSQTQKLIAISHGEHFYAAIRIIAHPPGDAQHVRLTLNKPTKAYTLNAAANHKTPRVRDRVIR